MKQITRRKKNTVGSHISQTQNRDWRLPDGWGKGEEGQKGTKFQLKDNQVMECIAWMTTVNIVLYI